MDWIPTEVPTNAAVIFGLACLAAGILLEQARKKIGRWAHWKVYHAGVHFPRRGRSG